MGFLASADVSSFCVGFAAGMLLVYVLAPEPRAVCRRPAVPPMAEHC